jgi:hypothetical protein
MVCQSAGNLEDYNVFGILRDYTSGTTYLGFCLPFGLLCLSSRFYSSKSSLNQLGPYLAGLIKVMVLFLYRFPVKETKKGRLLYPSLQISFPIKD